LAYSGDNDGDGVGGVKHNQCGGGTMTRRKVRMMMVDVGDCDGCCYGDVDGNTGR
jgi:hypothetical protein